MNNIVRKMVVLATILTASYITVACSLLSGGGGTGLTTVQGGGVPYGLKVKLPAPDSTQALYGVFPVAPQDQSFPE